MPLEGDPFGAGPAEQRAAARDARRAVGEDDPGRPDPEPKDTESVVSRRVFLAAGAAGAGLLGVGGYARFGEPGWLEVTEHVLGPRVGRIPLRIAHLTDLHLHELREIHEEVGEALEERAPDVVVLTGDSVDDRAGLPLLDQFLAVLPPSIPAFAIMGNWEHWGRIDIGALRRAYDRHDVRLLVNESAVVEVRGRELMVTGLDDVVGGRPDPERALEGQTVRDLQLLLAHCPVQRELLYGPPVAPDAPIHQYPFAAMLSGHTHGGQVNLLGWAPFTPRGSGDYVAGWYPGEGGRPPLYVSRGIGMSVAPVRFGARPELAFIDMRFPDRPGDEGRDGLR